MWHDGRPPSPSQTSMSFSAAFAHEKVQCISCVLCNFWNPYNVILAFLFSLSGEVKKKHSVIKHNDFYNTCWLLHSTFCQSSAESEFVLLLLWTQIPGNSSCIFFFCWKSSLALATLGVCGDNHRNPCFFLGLLTAIRSALAQQGGC